MPHQSCKRQKIGGYAGGSQRAEDAVKQPFTSCANRSSKRSHARASFTRNASFHQLSLSSFRKIVHQRRRISQTAAAPHVCRKNSNTLIQRFSLPPPHYHPQFLTARCALTYDRKSQPSQFSLARWCRRQRCLALRALDRHRRRRGARAPSRQIFHAAEIPILHVRASR